MQLPCVLVMCDECQGNTERCINKQDTRCNFRK